MACPHTMKATDGNGVTYCCDCGKVFRRPLSAKVIEARRPIPPAMLLDAGHERIDLPAKARVAKALRVPR